MKAFASHPDHGTQRAVYEATEGQYREAWTIRDRLEKAGIKIGSDLGQYVEMEYRAADGPITVDCIVEDSVLTDEALVERMLIEKLTAPAEAERARLGFAWAGGRRTADYDALRAYGRIYPGAVEPEGAAAERATVVADRLLAIDALRDAGDGAHEFEGDAGAGDERIDLSGLGDEYVALQEEYAEPTTDYGPEQLAQSGVIVHWGQGGVEIGCGLIRPGDAAAARGETTPAGVTGATGGGDAASGADGTPATGSVPGESEGTAPLDVPASLATDLRTERAIVIGGCLGAASGSRPASTATSRRWHRRLPHASASARRSPTPHQAPGARRTRRRPGNLPRRRTARRGRGSPPCRLASAIVGLSAGVGPAGLLCGEHARPRSTVRAGPCRDGSDVALERRGGGGHFVRMTDRTAVRPAMSAAVCTRTLPDRRSAPSSAFACRSPCPVRGRPRRTP